MSETRAEKAQRLVDEGQVKTLHRWFLYDKAVVQGDSGLHEVEVFASGRYFCDCDYGQYHSHTHDLCAHALAVKLAMEKENKP